MEVVTQRVQQRGMGVKALEPVTIAVDGERHVERPRRSSGGDLQGVGLDPDGRGDAAGERSCEDIPSREIGRHHTFTPP